MNIEHFQKKPIMGILRGISPDVLEPLMETIISSGLETVEITMNTKGAEELIKETKKRFGDKLTLGAGTVLNMEDLKKALDAGATFIVSPTLIEDVVTYCLDKNIPVFPGALTPQEIFKCWSAGASMVKVFPSNFFGPSYFQEIKGPFQDIKLLACGGVNPGNIQEYLSNGASAVAMGASVFKKDWLDLKDFSSISKSIKDLVSRI